MYKPIYKTKSVNPGEPSIYWKSLGGSYYRTRKEAIRDNGTNTIEYFDNKPYLYVVIAIVAVSVLYYFFKIRGN